MTKVKLLNVQQIIQWAGSQDVQFLGSNRSLPYIKRDGLFYYFTEQNREFSLAMTSLHDLGSFPA